MIHVVGESPRAIFYRSPGLGGSLMKNFQVSGVHGIFHRLKPIAIKLRLDENFPAPILPEPDVEIRYQRRRLRPQIGPVKTGELLHRIGLVLDGQMKLAGGRFCRRFQAISLCVV